MPATNKCLVDVETCFPVEFKCTIREKINQYSGTGIVLHFG